MRSAGLIEGMVPTWDEAIGLAQELLADQGTRLAHVLTAGRIAHAVGEHLSASGFLTPAEAHLLGVAATVHDIGYSPAVARSGFHPYDGAAHLRTLGWAPRLARLVANHSCSLVTAPVAIVPRLESEFPNERGLMPDALAYSDMHSSPAGDIIAAEARLADIARRHLSPAEGMRAEQLRIAIARVGEALQIADGAAVASGAAALGRSLAGRRVNTGLRAV